MTRYLIIFWITNIVAHGVNCDHRPEASGQRPVTIYYTTAFGSLLISSDNGETWTLKYPFRESEITTIIYTVWKIGGKLFLDTNHGLVWTSDANHISYDEDDDESWVTQPTFSNNSIIRRIQQAGSKFYLLLRDIGLYESDDEGTTWTFKSRVVGDDLFVSDNRLYSSRGRSLYKSLDSGKTWIESTITSLNDSHIIHRMIMASGDTIYVGTENDLHISYDHGNAWQLIEALRGLQIRSGVVSRNNVTYMGTYNGYYKSLDDGRTWEGPMDCGQMSTNWSSPSMFAIAYSGDTIYLGGYAGLFAVEENGVNVGKCKKLSGGAIWSMFIEEQ